MHYANKQMLEDILMPLKDRAKDEIRAFAMQPLGRLVKAAGVQVMRVKVEEREFKLEDLAMILNAAVSIEKEETSPEEAPAPQPEPEPIDLGDAK